MLLSVALALIATPHLQANGGAPNLEETVPMAFGDWQVVKDTRVQVDVSRGVEIQSEQPYDQNVMRTYVNSQGQRVMLALTQNNVSYQVYNSDTGLAQVLVADGLTSTVQTTALPPIELSAIAAGNGGFVINGQCTGDQSGWSVASAGDVNGDGLADLIVGAPKTDPAGSSSAGRSYVVFGTSGSMAVDLSAIAAGSGGFVINGQCLNDYSGWSVAGAGDVNGDGLADLIVGAPFSSAEAGRSYVVFGNTAGMAVDLSAVAAGSGGFVIKGQ